MSPAPVVTRVLPDDLPPLTREDLLLLKMGERVQHQVRASPRRYYWLCPCCVHPLNVSDGGPGSIRFLTWSCVVAAVVTRADQEWLHG